MKILKIVKPLESLETRELNWLENMACSLVQYCRIEKDRREYLEEGPSGEWYAKDAKRVCENLLEGLRQLEDPLVSNSVTCQGGK